jgi:hypothetical protein
VAVATVLGASSIVLFAPVAAVGAAALLAAGGLTVAVLVRGPVRAGIGPR